MKRSPCLAGKHPCNAPLHAERTHNRTEVATHVRVCMRVVVSDFFQIVRSEQMNRLHIYNHDTCTLIWNTSVVKKTPQKRFICGVSIFICIFIGLGIKIYYRLRSRIVRHPVGNESSDGFIF